MNVNDIELLPSPKSYVLTFPYCLFGTVSQSYLSDASWAAVTFYPKQNLTCNSQVVRLFS